MKAIILAGGGGTRLFPLSTEEKPKQFLPLVTDKPLLIDTAARLDGLCGAADIVVVTAEKYGALTRAALNGYGYGGVRVIAEPCRRNTMPAIILGAQFWASEMTAARRADEPIFVFPSDHAIADAAAFRAALSECTAQIGKGKLVTVGIKPTRPDTNYGYIKAKAGSADGGSFQEGQRGSVGGIKVARGAESGGASSAFDIRDGRVKEKSGSAVLQETERGGARDVEAFCEKPTAETAARYVRDGYYWNGGIYGFAYDTLKAETERVFTEFSALFALSAAEVAALYPTLTAISIDYAVSEKSKNIAVVPLAARWNDVGTFDSLFAYLDGEGRREKIAEIKREIERCGAGILNE